MKPRDFALRELAARDLPNWPARPSNSAPPPPPADARDLALAEHITIGTIKNLLLLQHLIQHFSQRSLKSIDVTVQRILAIGLYQLRFLDRIPPSAAVDEAVEQTRRFGRGRAAGFVNAVLRKAARDPAPPPPGRDAPREHAALALSHPPELFEKLEKLLGADDALRFCAHDQLEPPAIVRLYPGVDPASLASDGVELAPHEQPGMYIVTGGKRAHFADWAARGLAQAQDPTAAAVVPHLDLAIGETVLDRCCGMGTKTLQLRSAVGDAGHVVAIDPAPARVSSLKHLLDRRNLRNVHVHRNRLLADIPELAGRRFDAILIDAPCGNSGVLARRPEARYHQSRRALETLEPLQDEILIDTAPYLKEGSRLLYSTCSVWPEENQMRIDAFLRQRPDFERLYQETAMPSLEEDPVRYRDGGFIALLRRK